MAADITIFDAEKIEDTATFENPIQYPRGIDYVIVNGKVTVEKGRHTGMRAGKILKRRA
jgi:N-acyl-D-amino-acid deacylase